VQANLCTKAYFFGGHGILLLLLYGARTSILYVEETARDAALETMVWLSVAATVITFLLLQGSDPGYVVPGHGSFAGAPGLPTPAREPRRLSLYLRPPTTIPSRTDSVVSAARCRG